MTVSLIWAQDRNGAIGRDGTIPWQVPEDLARFRRLTMGATMLVGRKTWESLPGNLDGRRVVIASKHARIPSVPFTTSVDLWMKYRTFAPGPQDVWVIGGGDIYRQAMPYADVLHVTEIDVEVNDPDTYAPAIDPAEWQIADTGAWLTSTTGTRYRHRAYRRTDHDQ